MAGWRQQINRSSGGTHSTDDDNEAEEDKARAIRLVELRAQIQQEKEMARWRRREQQRKAAIDEEKKLKDSLWQLQKERLAYERQSSSSESLSTLHLAESERVKAAQLQQKHPAHTKQPVASSSPSDHSSTDPRRVRPVQDVRELPAREKKSETPSYLSDHRSTETRRVMEAELQQERLAYEKPSGTPSSLSDHRSPETRRVREVELRQKSLAHERHPETLSIPSVLGEMELQQERLSQNGKPETSSSLSDVFSDETGRGKASQFQQEHLAHKGQSETSSSRCNPNSADPKRLREDELRQERGRAHEKQLAASSSLSNLHSGELRQISKERQPNSSESLSVVPSAETRKKRPLALHLRRERLAHARQLEPSSSPSLSLADLRSAEIRRIREADADSESPVFVFFMNPKTLNDCLRLFFENKKRSGGGPIEELTRLNGVSAVIYFKNKQDAESVVKREKFTLDGHELLVRTPPNPDKIP